VVPTQILCVAGGIQAVLTGYPQVMLAMGKPRALLLFNIGILVTYGTAISLAAPHGIVVVSIVAATVYVAILVGVYRFLLQRYVGISLSRIVPELGPAFAAAAALVAVAAPLSAALGGVCPPAANLVLSSGAGLVAYGLVLWLGFRAAWNDFYMLLVRVVPPVRRIERLLRRSAPAPVAS
jgi:hypothetical protein